MKRRLSIFVLCIIICSMCISTVQAATLRDLEGHWSAGDVSKLINRGAVGGYPDGTFKPNATITRAEFSKILRQSLGLSTVTGSSFSDTANHWAVSDIQTLVANEIIVPSDYGDKYHPNYNITRREIATMLVRAMKLNDSAIAFAGEPTGFTDDQKLQVYEKGYIYLAKELGLVGGYEDGSFRPDNKATRAEACVMILRLLTNLGIDENTQPQPDATPTKPTEPVNKTDTSGKASEPAKQKNCEIIIKETKRTSKNSLDEQYLQATMQLTIPNETAKSLTVDESCLKTIVTYSNGAQITAKQTAFKTVIAANQTAPVDTTVNILLPNNEVATMVLGNHITDIEVQLTINGKTHTFDDIDAALLRAVH